MKNRFQRARRRAMYDLAINLNRVRRQEVDPKSGLRVLRDRRRFVRRSRCRRTRAAYHHRARHLPGSPPLAALANARRHGPSARYGATVAHCPTVFMRRGIAMNTFGAYARQGVNLDFGTDTYPHNFLEEMRSALAISRAVAGTVDDVTTLDVFNAATVCGARALLREDIGRLKVGAKADLVLVDNARATTKPALRGRRSGGPRCVCRRPVRRGRRSTGQDRPPDGLRGAGEAQKRSMREVPRLDWAGRTADQLAPLVLPISSA